jgi:hypothetical protein
MNTDFFYVDAKRLAAGYHSRTLQGTEGNRGKQEIGNLGAGRE